ncbi:antitoxin VbhA family protein [Massilia sp. B-10]|nr:antitoxin VbhA family protein [Massilia sp. B-10]UUZ52254.1 antitoxin VbhA family protein [Massilia sp. H-1]
MSRNHGEKKLWEANMNSTIGSDRRAAVESATASSALSGFFPSLYGLSVDERWIAGMDDVEAIALLKVHHKTLEDEQAATSDGKAQENLLGVTDSRRMRIAEADITTLKMAVLMMR